jgi:hypothetical protein
VTVLLQAKHFVTGSNFNSNFWPECISCSNNTIESNLSYLFKTVKSFCFSLSIDVVIMRMRGISVNTITQYNVVFEYVTLPFRICVDPFSYLGPKTGYPNRHFVDFLISRIKIWYSTPD